MCLVLPFISVKIPCPLLAVGRLKGEKEISLISQYQVNAKRGTNFLLKPQMLYCLTIMN